jgi:hypothetical protein
MQFREPYINSCSESEIGPSLKVLTFLDKNDIAEYSFKKQASFNKNIIADLY